MRYTFVAFTNAVEGKETDFNEWYDRQHIPDVLEVPGFASAQRFVSTDSQLVPAAHRYMTLYQIDTDNLDETLAAFGAHAAQGKIVMSDAVDRQGAVMAIYAAVNDPIDRNQAKLNRGV
jgi:hypothetical protein